MKQFTPEEIAEITKEYNDKRHQFDFPTISAAVYAPIIANAPASIGDITDQFSLINATP